MFAKIAVWAFMIFGSAVIINAWVLGVLHIFGVI